MSTTGASDSASSVKESFRTGSFSIDEYRRMKVVCIGAGFSGVVAGIRTFGSMRKQRALEGLGLPISTRDWHVTYLLIVINSPLSQTRFNASAPQTQWSASYAPGPEILAYLHHLVEKYKLMKYIRLQHELMHARWDEDSGKWHLRLRRPRFPRNVDGEMDGIPKDGEFSSTSESYTPVDEEFEEFEDVADIVFLGTGILSRWSWPNVDGLSGFKGRVLHSAQWDVSDGAWEEGVKGWGDKTVGVIGIGSSAIQIVPALQSKVKKVVNLARGKTWISSSFSESKMAELLSRQPGAGNYIFTDEEKESFKDPEYYKRFRHEVESDLNSVHGVSQRGSDMQKAAAAAFKSAMVQKLAKKPEIAGYIVPSFDVSCRRLTPGPGYLESLCEDNVDFETRSIKRITPTGVEFVDGGHTELDILVCATGFDTSFRMPFDVVGRARDLRERWDPHAVTYLSVAVDGFPNMFFSLGPNSAVNSGSLLILMERQVDYAVAATLKLQKERLKSIEVKAEAVADFDEYMKACYSSLAWHDSWLTLIHTPGLLFEGSSTPSLYQCNSWYRSPDGAITGLWPGSCLHAVRALSNPRWEDFNYEPLPGDKTRARFFWLGDGSTYNEKMMTGDRAWYLNDEQVDIPPGKVESFHCVSGIV
ncbi:hypothetical protein EW146_g6564 [Bondarzewia mesenterica]|uniref:Uncharacterized protein n=1 Tax=Bondarzewia mesenterica TaxID=1095465 RepID=A0A4S4LP36_9AGAM|nr:hypothetical protein EW146_g6564 [Bondarzewia mesenterica]